MTRKAFFAALLAAVGLKTQTPEKKRKFYITGGRINSDCFQPPLVSYGTNRVDALAGAGFTVWTQQEWEGIPTEVIANLHKGCERNGRCPVCGEQAGPWYPTSALPSYSLFGQDLTKAKIARCTRCSAAFWQDAETKKEGKK